MRTIKVYEVGVKYALSRVCICLRLGSNDANMQTSQIKHIHTRIL